MKNLISALSAWVSFLISISVIFLLVNVFQNMFGGIEIEGLLAIVLLIIGILISIYTAYRITKWQHVFLDQKSRTLNVIVMVILILISASIIPVPMMYSAF